MDEVLQRPRVYGKRLMRGGWRGVITEDEARSAGLLGLQRAIEKHRGVPETFENYAKILIASRIGDEVRAARRRAKKLSDVRVEKAEVEKQVIFYPENTGDERFRDLELLINHLGGKPHIVGLYALSLVAGVGKGRQLRGTRTKLATLLKVRPMTLSSAVCRARRLVAKLKSGKQPD